MKLLLLCVPERSGIVEDLFFLAVLGNGEGGRRWRDRGVKMVLHLCALDLGRTTALKRRKLPLVSFSCGGDPRKEVVWLEVDDDANVEEEEVVSAPMVLGVMSAEVVDMVSVAKVR